MADIKIGAVAAFFDKGNLLFGLIQSVNPSTVELICESGEPFSLPIARLQLISGKAYQGSQSPNEALAAFIKELDAKLASFSPVTIDEALTAGASTWEEIQPEEDLERFAAFFYLRNNPHRYSWKKQVLRLRSMEEEATFLAQLHSSQEAQDYLLLLSPKLQALIDGKLADLSIEQKEELSSRLRDYQSEGSQTELIKVIAALESELHLSERIIHLRRSLGDLTDSTDPILAASGMPVSFPHKLDHSLLPIDEALPHFEAFCIDDADSTDFDDAISWQTIPEGFELGIHISAVASRIALSSALIKEAYSRVSSLYLCPGNYPLLPPLLSEGELSLKKGELKPCLSLVLTLSPDFKILSERFVETCVEIKQNYSYKEIDKRIRDKDFSELSRLCKSLSQARAKDEREDEARLPVCYLKLKDGKIKPQIHNQNSPSRRMIEELMVLYNSKFAVKAMDAGLALIYRSLTVERSGWDDSLLTSTAYLSTQASFHPGIGAAAYVHASSPIRRLTDLINQYQMLSLMRGDATPFTSEDLQEKISYIEQRLLWQRELIQASERYWTLRYIEQTLLHQPIEAVLLKRGRQHLVVELPSIYKRISFHSDSDVPIGAEIRIVINSVNLEKGYASGDVIC